MDPGNIATNLAAGAEFDVKLLWVVALATLTAWLVQYLSAKLGLITSKTVPELMGERLKSSRKRIAFWLQAQVAATATDVAEVIGGAIALNLLFQLPYLLGGAITGIISMALLSIHSRGLVRAFEVVILGLVLTTGFGFIASLTVSHTDLGYAVRGLVPALDSRSLLLVAGIIGATIMPHAIYAHSALTRDRFKGIIDTNNIAKLLRVTRWDVTIAMVIAGGISASVLFVGAIYVNAGDGQSNWFAQTFRMLGDMLGHGFAILFAVGLLASGLASSAVGTYAGGVISSGLLQRKFSPLLLRLLTLVPALAVLALPFPLEYLLVLSQVLLSFCLPFALFPLVRLTSDSKLMGKFANSQATRIIGYAVTVVITVLNLYLFAGLILGN
jgi:manganese transport protein